MYTTTKGFIHLCDLRDQSSFQNKSSLSFEVGKGLKRNAFSDMLNAVSFGKFLKYKQNWVTTRDYLSVKLWDIRGTS